ncbi:sex hormone-binding globulin [Bombina bombina]|uniref:sex hormone-binding globulin n=1 Tax=Bombina bombina TaxID=8345 RepID=UPI00235A8B33|nr:sex hormone-binding globulin [Bombina bombina]
MVHTAGSKQFLNIMFPPRWTLILFLFSYGDFTESTPLAVPDNENPLPEQVSCSAMNPVRSSDSLYLGSDGRNPLHMEFQFSDISSNLSSFDFRTFDSEGIIFYGDVGMDSWFVLGVRERKMEVQMSNSNGQMVLSKWGPDVSDGKWRKVVVDSRVNTVEVTVDGELVVRLTHHVNLQLSPHSYSKLSIILGGLPVGPSHQLLRPLQPALDGCIRNWAWVKKDVQVLVDAMEKDENLRCFEEEEPGSYFPSDGYAIFKPSMFQPPDNEPWGLAVRISFRVQKGSGTLLAINGPGNVTMFAVTVDWQKQVLVITLPGKLPTYFNFPLNLCSGQWQFVDIKIQSNHMLVSTEHGSSSWNMNPAYLKVLENTWLDPTSQIFIGGFPDETAEEETHFSGCLKIILQGEAVSLDKAQYKHPHVRTHSCPRGIQLK